MRIATHCANVALIPVQPSQFDVWTVPSFDELIGDVKMINEKLRALFCISIAPTNPKLAREIDATKHFLSHIKKPKYAGVAETIICDRVIYRKAAAEGRSIVEIKPNDSQAENELNSLYKELFNGY